MMATIFIGDEDFVFRWQDHKELLAGITCGVLLTAIVLITLRSVREEKQPYDRVVMDEVKAKAMD